MYFSSLYADSALVRLNCDFREGKPSVNLFPINNGQVDWNYNKAYLSINFYELTSFNEQLKKTNQAILNLQKGQSTLNINFKANGCIISHSYQNRTISAQIVRPEDIFSIKYWVSYSVEIFPGELSLFHDLITIIKPEYYQERKDKAAQKSQNSFNPQSSGYNNENYNRPNPQSSGYNPFDSTIPSSDY